MQSKTRLILLNVIGCILFLALPLLFAPPSTRFIVELTSPPTIKEIIAYSLLIVYFYLNFFVLIPQFYFKHKYVVFAGLTILCFLIITIMPGLIMGANAQLPRPMNTFSKEIKLPPPNDSIMRPLFKDGGGGPPGIMPPPNFGGAYFSINTISHHLFLFLGVFFFSLLLKINNRWKKAEEEKVSTELSYLKAQINPHFLFNTLNSIYSMALEKSDNTATAVVKLSAMMRYVLSDADKDFVPLGQDINYITSYVELQRIRFDEALPLTYNVTGDTIGKKIAPLILIPFIENAFKHGINAEEQSAIKIDIAIKENELNLLVENNKVSFMGADEERTGVGIENVKSRLILLYPGKHELFITDSENTFSVSLKLDLA